MKRNLYFFYHNEEGFTLLEIMVVLLISGLIIVPLASSYSWLNEFFKNGITKTKIETINDALSLYSAQYYRAPCPANPSGEGVEPFGTEMGSGLTGIQFGKCQNFKAGDTEGIIPYITLGLERDMAKDGWGNYFTYQVSPSFTIDPEEDDVPVHARCRTTKWIEGASSFGARFSGGKSITQEKARFCCMKPDIDSQSQVFYKKGSKKIPVILFKQDPDRLYNRVNKIEASNLVETLSPIRNSDIRIFRNQIHSSSRVSGHTDMIVYVLISHGKNNSGSFLGDKTLDRSPSYTKYEGINADSKNPIVYDLEYNNSRENYYDDIVSWQTQSSLLSRLRRNTCAVP